MPRRASFAAGETDAAPPFEAGVADSLASMDSLRKGREYAVAWELEVWKQAQEAKWTATMRAREAERMAALEGEWRRREAQREAEHRRTRDAARSLSAEGSMRPVWTAMAHCSRSMRCQ